MDKNNKYKFVFESAKKFLNEIIDENKLDRSIIEGHLRHEKFHDIPGINRRLIRSLSNRNMMNSVIGFDNKEKEMRSILFEYTPNKILSTYINPDELLEKFKIEFKLQNIRNKRSLWRKFSEGIISGSEFMASFTDKNDFDKFIKTFSHNKYTKAALPMLLSKEIKGFGFALACDFLKEIGYRDYPKPDVMLIDVFYGLKLSKSNEQYDVYKTIIEMAEAVGEDAYTIDKIFWLIGSGKLVDNKSIGSNRDKFIMSIKAKLKNL